MNTLPPSRQAEQLFPGKGEIAQLMRQKDWSQTPLGPVGSWPHSLRTAVSICLGSRHPIVLWWGPERWMFYNEAYRPLLGENRHPQFLGGSGRECWAEIWNVIGPMMDHVIATGEATWSENLFLLMTRRGYLEETYFTFSYSPICDEEGHPSGIFNACTETTAQVLAERRMKTLREMPVDARTSSEAARRLAETMGRNSRDIPFALIYLLDSGGTHLRLQGHAGLTPETAASPLTVARGASDPAGWPLDRVLSRGEAELIQNLVARFDCLPKDPWNESAKEAMVLPIARPGSAEPAGVLVLGINPRRAFDDEYRGFFELAAGHVSTALASARAFESERDRAEKLAELDRAKTEFFSNVSHEFRTPLTLMLGPLEDELAEQNPPLPGPRHERLEAVHRNSLRLLKLVNSLLEFARVEAGRAQANYQPTDLAKYTAELASSFRSALDRAGLDFTIDCPPLPEPVYVDREMWERIVLNLISNAFKHTFKGGVTVRVRSADGDAELVVSDTGVGISAADCERLFERFHRVKGAESRSHEGSGIGLALVKELSLLHGGSVSVRSEPGKGSTFSVRVKMGREHIPAERLERDRPARPAGSSATAYVEEALRWLPEPEGAVVRTHAIPGAAAALARNTSPQDSGPRPRILVADDNADMRDYIAHLLVDRYEVRAVSDGTAALHATREDPPPDLVLSDVMMPGLDGFGLLRELRADPTTRSLPFILLSARAGEDSTVEGLGVGADDYIMKPFSARELLARVRTHLEIARIRRQSAKELERANKELEAFSYSVSHDLRAPLRTIDGFAKMLLEDYGEKLDAEGHRRLAMVVGGAGKMGQLIDDLLEFARLGRREVKKTAFDPNHMMREILKELLSTCPERKIEVSFEPLPPAWGDPSLLRQVFFNLVSNAVKYTRGRSPAQIEIGGSSAAKMTSYWIKDNGVGFKLEYAHKLFGVFQRLHSEKEFEGTGVGLALVQRIVERHSGRVWAEATPDRGATFSFTLPVKEDLAHGGS